MTALDDAARAVARAEAAVFRELTHPTEWESGEYGSNDRDARRLVDTLTAAVRHHDAEVVRDLSRQGYSTQEAAKKIEPEEGA